VNIPWKVLGISSMNLKFLFYLTLCNVLKESDTRIVFCTTNETGLTYFRG